MWRSAFPYLALVSLYETSANVEVLVILCLEILCPTRHSSGISLRPLRQFLSYGLFGRWNVWEARPLVSALGTYWVLPQNAGFEYAKQLALDQPSYPSIIMTIGIVPNDYHAYWLSDLCNF